MFNFSKSKKINLVATVENDKKGFKLPNVFNKKVSLDIFLKTIRFVFYFVLFFILLLFIFIIPVVANLKQVVDLAIDGKTNAEEALSLAEHQDFKQALVFAEKAKYDFDNSIEIVRDLKKDYLPAKVFFIKDQFNNLEYLLESASILADSLKKGINFGQSLEDLLEGDKDLSFSKFSKEEKRKILERIYGSGPELAGMKASLDLSLVNLENIKDFGLLFPIKSEVINLKEKIYLARDFLSDSISLSKILTAMAGYPEKSSFLVLLENSDELRPTGGFIGTYGILETEFGDILRFDTHDVYNLEKPIEGILNVEQPEPLQKYLGVNRWYMRDANWSPDWPTAAKKIEWFFYKENNLLKEIKDINNFSGEFNGVIAITPELVIDLLDIVGPINIDGDEYNKDNFVELLQYKVEQEYVELGVPKWRRKEVIGRIFRELKIRLFDLPSSRWPEIVGVIKNNAVRKNILFFMKDNELEELIKNYGWGGEIKQVDGDFLMVVDANLGAFKTDAVMNKSIDYKIEERHDGFFVKLKINYAHNGVGYDWKTTKYRTYTRVYVPLGSELLRADGFSDGDVKIGDEFGYINKTYFGGFISINPGERGSLYFEYKLPEELAGHLFDNGYSLYAQKQPGSVVAEFNVDFRGVNRVESYSPSGFYVDKVNDNEILWKGDLKTDKEFKVNF